MVHQQKPLKTVYVCGFRGFLLSWSKLQPGLAGRTPGIFPLGPKRRELLVNEGRPQCVKIHRPSPDRLLPIMVLLGNLLDPIVDDLLGRLKVPLEGGSGYPGFFNQLSDCHLGEILLPSKFH